MYWPQKSLLDVLRLEKKISGDSCLCVLLFIPFFPRSLTVPKSHLEKRKIEYKHRFIRNWAKPPSLPPLSSEGTGRTSVLLHQMTLLLLSLIRWIFTDIFYRCRPVTSRILISLNYRIMMQLFLFGLEVQNFIIEIWKKATIVKFKIKIN